MSNEKNKGLVLEDLFELGSYCLLGINNEVLFEYPHRANYMFSHDEFHMTLSYESDLYDVYLKNETRVRSELKLMTLHVEENRLVTRGGELVDNEVIYKSGDLGDFDAQPLITAIDQYLEKFVFVKRSKRSYRGNVLVTVDWNGIRERVRKEQFPFSGIESEEKPAAKKRPAQPKTAVKKEIPKSEATAIAGVAILDGLVGLQSIKDDMKKLNNRIIVDLARAEHGMSSYSLSYHSVFKGNPGTGKTTVAREMGSMLKRAGVLSSGHVVEVSRANLVGKYVGHTATITNELINSAIGGILFVDEAYTLVSENKGDYGQEAIDTILKRMEDDRDDLVVIVAGYNEKMDGFIDSNPGLKSRFTNVYRFMDYSPQELEEIFVSLCLANGYVVEDNTSLLKQMSAIKNAEGKNFSNGRMVRNLFEKTLLEHSDRVAGLIENGQEISKTLLTTFSASDISSAAKRLA